MCNNYKDLLATEYKRLKNVMADISDLESQSDSDELMLSCKKKVLENTLIRIDYLENLINKLENEENS